MNPYSTQLRGAIAATRFLSASEILWFGKPAVAKLPRRLRRWLSPATLRDYARFSLQDRLYADFYSKGIASASDLGRFPMLDAASSSRLAQELSKANCGEGYLDPGWTIRHVDGATLVVGGPGIELKVSPGDCDLRDAAVTTPGAQLALRLPNELRARLPRFYVAMGNNSIPRDPEPRRLIRLYWNVTGHGAIELVRWATRLLNEGRVPFELKIANDVAQNHRCDAAVLYLRQADFPLARPFLQAVHREVASRLRSSVPALSRRLAHGLAVAEDPERASSFGEHRCRLLATALIRAHDLGKTSVDERFGVVDEVFFENGVRLDAPYLNPDSNAVYEFESDSAPRATNRPFESGGRRAARPTRESNTANEYLLTAHTIGAHICQSATWSGGRCNWMGADVDTVGNARWRTLGPDLYDGTAGVALFLAELFGASGDTRLRTTAVGAMRHALDRVERLPSSHALGLFTGRIGVAMAAARVGCITGVDELPARAPHILNSLEINRDEVPPYDVISGMAGAIVGLLVLRELLPEPSLFDRAEGFGHALLDGAHKLKRGWSWKTLNARGEADLTGFSHGAAGIGYALLELFAASGDSRYAAGAMQAFAFERSWFSAANRNWPDLRGLSSRTTRPDQSLPACPFWCHGAPGIAVSRIRGFDITRDDHCHTEAIMALTTTAAVTEGALRNDDLNYSLCHGLSGNAEILRLGERALGDAVVGASRIVSEVAAAGIEKYGAEPTSWPCGAGGLTPALMTGLAGIGHYYLRLFSSAVPSVLMLTPGDFAGVVEHDAASTPVAARTG